MKFSELLHQGKFLIGMSHMPPVYEGLESWLYAAERNAEALAEGGITTVIIENDGDKDIVANPRYRTDDARLGLVRRYMVASGQKLRATYGDELFIGVQILWNDWQSIAVAKEIGADFVRSQLYWEQRFTHSGLQLEPVYFSMSSFRKKHSPDISVLADINSKGTRPVGDYSLGESIGSLLKSPYAPDALVVTGSATGNAPDVKSVREFCSEVERHAQGFPVGGGSGLTSENTDLLTGTDARFWIVGSSLKTGGYADPLKAREIVAMAGKAGKAYVMEP